MKKILIFALCWFAFVALNAQGGWEKIINNGEFYNHAVDFWEAPDGSFVVLYNLTSQFLGEQIEETEIHLAQLDQDGTTINDHVISNGVFFGRRAYDMLLLPSGNLLLSGKLIASISPPTKTFVMEVTMEGQIIWEKSYSQRTAVKLMEAGDGNFFMLGETHIPDQETYMTKISAVGDSLWTTYPVDYANYSLLTDAQLNADGNIYLFSLIFSGNGRRAISTVDFSGTLLSETIIQPEGGEQGNDLLYSDFISLPLGGFAMVASNQFEPSPSSSPIYERFMVYRYNENIELEWATEVDSIHIDNFNILSNNGRGSNQISLDVDGNFSALFSTYRIFPDNTPADYSRRHFAKIDPSGVILSNHFKELEQREYPVAFEKTSTGGYFFCGWHLAGFPDPWGTPDWSLGVRLDTEGNSITNEINGNLYWDENLDCDNQAEPGIEGWIMQAKNDALSYYDITDADGNYSITTGTGNYNLKAFPPNEYWDICEGIVPMIFTDTYDTLTQNLSAQALLDCPGMWVDISTRGLRNCFDNTYTVNYCNYGTINEDEAYIEVSLPTGMNIVEADIPYIEMADGTLFFDIGAVAVNECGSFQLIAYVDCEVIELGETLCTEAHIYPDTLCMPGLMWTGASIQVRGECDADNITYTIKNVGDAPTSQTLNYVVVEDQIILLEGDFNLNPEEEEIIMLPVTGATYRLEAEQEPNHPGFSMPSLAIEGCGGLTPGQVNLFSMDDNDVFIDIDCREVVASYDPNDKTGYPLGYTEEHFIEKNTALEYVIRFQNTGTDTAFRVVLRDTLSPFLDPTTVRAGSSSHPYTFDMLGNGVLKFTFNPILLPDSTTNELASQGFVKFSVNQHAGNETGTVIHNTAAIYFDFNEAVITNQTVHTIGEAFFTNVEYLSEDNDPMQVSVYPNPFSTIATIEIEDYAFTAGRFELFDITGRSLQTQKINNPAFTFERNNLAAGTYAFVIYLDKEKIITGKLIIL